MAGFIPKEELTGYQRWQAGSFDTKTTRATSTPPPQITGEKASIPDDNTGKINLPTAEDLERLYEETRTEGYKAGFDEGRLAGEQSAIAKNTQEAENFLRLIENLQTALGQMDQKIAEQLLDLALEVAQQVIRGTIESNKEMLLPTIREAIAALPLHHGHPSLHLNPTDANAIRGVVAEQLAHTGIQIVEDSSVLTGGCLLVAGTSEIDASIETRWKRVLEAIGTAPTEWLNKA